MLGDSQLVKGNLGLGVNHNHKYVYRFPCIVHAFDRNARLHQDSQIRWLSQIPVN